MKLTTVGLLLLAAATTVTGQAPCSLMTISSHIAVIDAACCKNQKCPGGTPKTCSPSCAGPFLKFTTECAKVINSMADKSSIRSLEGKCQATISHGGAGGSAPYFTCTSQVDFVGAASSFIKGICCTQESETCGRGLYPSTCASPECARAVKMVGDGCLGWLAEPDQAMLSGFATPLKNLVDTCNATQPAPHTILLTSATSTLAGPAACGATIIDGRAESSINWHDDLAITAPAGMTAMITVQTLWLPDSDALEIHDGVDADATLLARLQGTTKPGAPTYAASGQTVFLRLLSNGENIGKAVGFSLQVGCSCSATSNACGAHGSCRDGACVCITGWMGPTCAVAEPEHCASAPCQHNGTCVETLQGQELGGHRRSLAEHMCALDKLHTSTTAITTQCCGNDDTACSKGTPTSCDTGCASVFLPFWTNCGSTFASSSSYKDLVSVFKLCKAAIASSYQCICVAGWSGPNCSTKQPPKKIDSWDSGIQANANLRSFSLYLLPAKSPNYFSHDAQGAQRYAQLCSAAGLLPVIASPRGASPRGLCLANSCRGQAGKTCAPCAFDQVQKLYCKHFDCMPLIPMTNEQNPADWVHKMTGWIDLVVLFQGKPINYNQPGWNHKLHAVCGAEHCLVDCGAHGRCNAKGACVCEAGFTGAPCVKDPCHAHSSGNCWDSGILRNAEGEHFTLFKQPAVVVRDVDHLRSICGAKGMQPIGCDLPTYYARPMAKGVMPMCMVTNPTGLPDPICPKKFWTTFVSGENGDPSAHDPSVICFGSGCRCRGDCYTGSTDDKRDPLDNWGCQVSIEKYTGWTDTYTVGSAANQLFMDKCNRKPYCRHGTAHDGRPHHPVCALRRKSLPRSPILLDVCSIYPGPCVHGKCVDGRCQCDKGPGGRGRYGGYRCTRAPTKCGAQCLGDTMTTDGCCW